MYFSLSPHHIWHKIASKECYEISGVPVVFIEGCRLQNELPERQLKLNAWLGGVGVAFIKCVS